jgi:hypothetical protein
MYDGSSAQRLGLLTYDGLTGVEIAVGRVYASDKT